MTIGKNFAKALKTTLAGQAVVLDYGDKDTFVKLWKIEAKDSVPEAIKTGIQCDASCGDQSKIASIILVWDGRAFEESDAWDSLLKPHLTPMDWALAFSVRALGQMENCPDISIHILDLTGQDHAAWSMCMRHQLLADMPWVTLHAPLIPQAVYRKGYQPILNDCNSLLTNDSGELELNASGVAKMKTHISQGYGRNLRDMTQQWASTLLQSHDHHDLNNSVGPWILAGVPPPDPMHCDNVTSLSAFWARLKWTEVLPQDGTIGTGAGFGEEQLDVFVIDDQLYTGWDNVICLLFGANALGQEESKSGGTSSWRLVGQRDGMSVHGSDSAHSLGENLNQVEQYKIRVYDSPFPDGDGQRPWILVLDLLLFPGRPSKEHAWFRTLLTVAQGIVDAQSQLAWLGISKEEIDEVNNWLDSPPSDNNHPAYDTALSLLPRLCALRWPSVPIILFSGSTRRALTAKLSDYRNIFLASPKPNLFAGNPQEHVNAFENGWRNAIDSTKGLIDVQRRLLKLKPSDHKSTATDGAENGEYHHLTIALDESGDFSKHAYAAVGGVVIEAKAVEGNEIEEAKVSTFEFLENLRKEGVRFYDHVPAYTEINKVGKLVEEKCIKKGAGIGTYVKAAKEKSTSCRLGSFRCLIPKKLCQDASKGFSDGAFLAYLRATLELLLTEYIASLGYDLETTSLSIWLPTRSVQKKRTEPMRMDFETHGRMMQTIGGKSVAYAIVRTALERRQKADEILNRSFLKLRKIPYYNGKDNRYSALNWYCNECNSYSGGVEKRRGPRLNDRGEEYAHCPKAHGECRETGHSGEYLAADYSVAQHLADASLSNAENGFPSKEIGPDNIDKGISFDVVAGHRWTDFLRVGRAFESKMETEGFKAAYRHSFFVAGLQRKGSELTAPVHAQIVDRLRNHAKYIDGNTLMQLASLSYPTTKINITFIGSTDESILNQISSETREKLGKLLYDYVPKIRKGKSGRKGNPNLTFAIDVADEITISGLLGWLRQLEKKGSLKLDIHRPRRSD